MSEVPFKPWSSWKGTQERRIVEETQAEILKVIGKSI
jgi:hypothetical protein